MPVISNDTILSFKYPIVVTIVGFLFSLGWGAKTVLGTQDTQAATLIKHSELIAQIAENQKTQNEIRQRYMYDTNYRMQIIEDKLGVQAPKKKVSLSPAILSQLVQRRSTGESMAIVN